MTKKRATFAVHNSGSFVDACVSDAITLANAAFETASSNDAGGTPAHACAWQFIRYYYSAYFAGNALMRLCGHACSNLAAIECQQVNEQALLYGVGGASEKDKIVPGLYYLQFDPAKTQCVKLRVASGKGGVHAQFWVGFMEFLACLSADIKKGVAPSADKAAALAEITALSSELQRMGTPQGSRLSEIRNAVNYRFEHGLWFPYNDAKADRSTLATAFAAEVSGATTIANMGSATSEVVRATRTCAYLLAWLQESMAIIGGTARGTRKRLIEDGVLAFASAL